MTDPEKGPAELPEAVLTFMLACFAVAAFIWGVAGTGPVFWTVTAGSAVCMAAAAGWGVYATRRD